MSNEFSFDIGERTELFDEKGTVELRLADVDWGGGHRLELRKWYVGSDGVAKPNKGFGFLTDEGPHNLCYALLRLGYGKTEEVVQELYDRDPVELETAYNKVVHGEGAEVFYDPKSILE